MKISPKVTKTLELGLYGAFIAYFIKIISTIIFGYVYLPSKYAGPVYYYWRKTYCDAEASKSSYAFIAPLMEDESELFKTFHETVQPMVNPKQFQAKSQDLNEKYEKNKDSSFSYFKSKATKAKEELDEMNRVEKNTTGTKITANGQSPLYSIGGFTDTFILGPKKTFKIFGNAKEFDSQALQSELDFLAFRYVFLQYLSLNTKTLAYTKDGKKAEKVARNYTVLEKKHIQAFFTKNVDEVITKTATSSAGLNKVTFTGVPNSPVMLLSDSQVEAVKKYRSLYVPFNELMTTMSSKTSDNKPLIDFADNEVVINEAFLKNARKISTLLGITSEESFDEAFKAFIQRLSVVKPNAYDAHILNRFYYYYLFVNSDMDPSSSDKVRSDEKYTTLQKSIASIDTTLDELSPKISTDSGSKDKFQEYVLKKDILSDKLAKRRTELIFNNLSQIIASQFGSKGYALSSEDDDRMFILKYFAYPGMFSTSQEETVGSVFQAPTQVQN